MGSYIFLRTAWMTNYQGVTDNDRPSGAGSYVTDNEDGGEVCNFVPINGYYYGYARIQAGRNLRIERLGAQATDEYLDNVNVILFAKNPSTGGQYIVGWYKNARLFRNTQRLKQNLRLDHYLYLSKARISDSFLVPLDDRVFEIPLDGPGQTNAWYIEEYSDRRYLKEVKSYIDNPDSYISRKPIKKVVHVAWQNDAELRKKIEVVAMDTVASYFSDRGFEITYCHKENFGWDLEAIKQEKTFLLEVKGLSGDFICIDLTPNEYLNSIRNRKHYRICVVSNALNESKRLLNIFYWSNGDWICDNMKLTVNERVSARLILKS